MLGIIGLVVIIVAPFFIYRNAKQNGHNPILWAALAFGAGIGLQIILPLLIGIVWGIVMALKGKPPAVIQQSIQGYAAIIGVISLALSVGGVLLIMRRVNSIRDTEEVNLPPAPPNFN
ncbi:MAG: hypothetical protein ACR2GD_00685 [Pyrinomonadaceae bacterium]